MVYYLATVTDGHVLYLSLVSVSVNLLYDVCLFVIMLACLQHYDRTARYSREIFRIDR